MNETRALGTGSSVHGAREARRSAWSSAALLSALLGGAGCGADAVDVGEALESRSQALQPPQGWRLWSEAPSNPGTTATFAGNPAVCLATGDGVLIAGRDAGTNRFRSLVNQWRLFSQNPVWADLGIMTFSSKPACTALDEVAFDPPAQLNNQIAILGKRDTDNKYYARVFEVDTTLGNWPNDPPDQPTPQGFFTKISDDVYESAPGTTVAYGRLLAVGRRDNDQLYLHQNPLTSDPESPYNASGWQSAVPLPPLPGPWVAAGDPAIANTVPMIGVVTIMTRARSGMTNRLYYIWWDGTSFYGAAGGTWMQHLTGSTVVYSDPALEVDVGPQAVNLMTVYIRGATNDNGTITNQNRIFQASGIGPSLWENFSIVREQDADTFASPSAPAAVGSGNFEGEHLVVAKKSNNQFYWSTPVPF